jgi:hypothetical protein
MKTYEIKKELIKTDENGVDIFHYNIYYYIDGIEETKEFHSKDGINGNIKEGYSLIVDENNINEYKKHIVDLIDTKSEEKIFEGFLFDGKRFSLSLSAQINWSNLLFLPESFFPVNLSTKDDDVYSLTYANVQLFYQAALNGKNSPLQEGNVLKQQVKAATTKEELDLIKNSL